MKGKVKFFNEKKGYGFVIGDDDKDYFFHKNNIENFEELNSEDEVSFNVSKTDRGMTASNVTKK